VFDVQPRRSGFGVGAVRFGGGGSRIPRRQFMLFNQQMVALLRAGLPLLQALDVVLERLKEGPFRRALTDIRHRVSSGSAMSEAFVAQGDAFPRVYAASLTAGERSGELATVMGRYLAFARKTEAVRTRVVSALLYPFVLCTLSVLVVGVLLFYALPKFSTFYAEFEAELPGMTQMVIGLSKWLQSNALVLGILAVGGTVFVVSWRRTDAGRLFFDRLQLKLPVLGEVLRQYHVAQFARTLATLLSGGIPLVSALQTATGALGNRAFVNASASIAEEVRQGRALWDSTERTGEFTDLTIELMKVGESTGSLDAMLANVADYYDEQVDEALTRMVSLFEPLLLVGMGLVIAVLLISMYLPIFNLASTTA
jgi:type IV pilus assembly protein PilC